MNIEATIFQKLFVVTSNEHRLRAQKVLPQLPKKKLVIPNAKMPVGSRAPDVFRFEHTMHIAPLPRKWLSSIGCWGQVMSLQEITDRCKVDLSAAKTVRYRYGLKTASPTKDRRPRRPQVDVAMDCWVDWTLAPKVDAQAEAQRWAQKTGVLPIEFCLYNFFIDTILGETEVDLSLEPEDLWRQQIEVVEPQWPKYEALLRDAVTKYDGA